MRLVLRAFVAVVVVACTPSIGRYVTNGPPSQLTYAQNPAAYQRARPITANVPRVLGAATNFTITPALPPGLSFDETTGAISGTPVNVSPPVIYSVRASNSFGSTEASLTLSVVDASLSGLAYAQNPVVFTRGLASSDVAVVSGGVASDFSA